MEELIELLSKAKPLAPWFWWDVRNNGAMIISKEEKNNWHSWEICFVKKEELCWKEYGFIKWLVQNDKIDLLKLTCMNPRYTEILDSDFSWKERIIMILSIEENPISFLISILN